MLGSAQRQCESVYVSRLSVMIHDAQIGSIHPCTEKIIPRRRTESDALRLVLVSDNCYYTAVNGSIDSAIEDYPKARVLGLCRIT